MQMMEYSLVTGHSKLRTIPRTELYLIKKSHTELNSKEDDLNL